MTFGRSSRRPRGSEAVPPEMQLCATCRGGIAGAVSPEEREVLAGAEMFLRRGLDLKHWWDNASATGCFAERFPLTTSFNRPDLSYGFFDVARVEGRDMPILGNFQTLFYDQPKSPGIDQAAAAGWMRDQMREFILHYFMRVSSFRQPSAFIPFADRRPVPPPLRSLSQCPRENPSFVGFGFSQLFYKCAGCSGGGCIGAFPEVDRYGYFAPDEAAVKINEGQRPLLDALADAVVMQRPSSRPRP